MTTAAAHIAATTTPHIETSAAARKARNARVIRSFDGQVEATGTEQSFDGQVEATGTEQKKQSKPSKQSRPRSNPGADSGRPAQRHASSSSSSAHPAQRPTDNGRPAQRPDSSLTGDPPTVASSAARSPTPSVVQFGPIPPSSSTPPRPVSHPRVSAPSSSSSSSSQESNNNNNAMRKKYVLFGGVFVFVAFNAADEERLGEHMPRDAVVPLPASFVFNPRTPAHGKCALCEGGLGNNKHKTTARVLPGGTARCSLCYGCTFKVANGKSTEIQFTLVDGRWAPGGSTFFIAVDEGVFFDVQATVEEKKSVPVPDPVAYTPFKDQVVPEGTSSVLFWSGKNPFTASCTSKPAMDALVRSLPSPFIITNANCDASADPDVCALCRGAGDDSKPLDGSVHNSAWTRMPAHSACVNDLARATSTDIIRVSGEFTEASGWQAAVDGVYFYKAPCGPVHTLTTTAVDSEKYEGARFQKIFGH